MEIANFPTANPRMSKKFILIGFLIATAAMISWLINTNPAQEQFHTFIVSKLHGKYQSALPSEWQKVPDELNDYLNETLPMITQEKNFGICTLFSLKLAHREFQFLGIAGKYIALQNEEFPGRQ
jgi:hypothetical protein